MILISCLFQSINRTSLIRLGYQTEVRLFRCVNCVNAKCSNERISNFLCVPFFDKKNEIKDKSGTRLRLPTIVSKLTIAQTDVLFKKHVETGQSLGR